MRNTIECTRKNKMFELKPDKNQQKILSKNGTELLSFHEAEPLWSCTLPWHFSGRVLALNNLQCLSTQLESILVGLVEVYSKDYDCLRLALDNSASRSLAPFLEHRFQDAKGQDFAEHRLREDCPLAPILMEPCFRHGDMTPWGGEKLKTLFHKNIPDSLTGESLEISAIPGLESQDAAGVPLSEFIEKYGACLLGDDFSDAPFPLLLKLLDAKALLSIQVHPDDAYAAAHENGKRGKEEAWVVLDCEPDAKLVYGLKPGTSKEELAACLHAGASPEHLVSFAHVKKGDIFYIPPGTVHALGSGIVVYEIQQSSDVTYRMWDWSRVDSAGRARALHIEDSLCNIQFGQCPAVSQLPTTAGKHRLIDARHFILCAVNVTKQERLEHDGSSFLLLTALSPLCLEAFDQKLSLRSGQSLLIPASLKQFSLTGQGCALVVKPKGAYKG